MKRCLKKVIKMKNNHSIGLLLVSHNTIGRDMMEAAELILGRTNLIRCVSVRSKDKLEEVVEVIKHEADELKSRCEAILILTDMWGASPANSAVEAVKNLRSNNIETALVTGLNLPMLISAIAYHREMNIQDLVKKVIEVGKMSHLDATKII